MQILQANTREQLVKLMRDIRVDPYGIKIMSCKGITHLIRLRALSTIAANILKQEMLSLGGDVAVARDALTGRTKRTDCLVMGSVAQINRLNEKLKRQPFGLHTLGVRMAESLTNYHRNDFVTRMGRYTLDLGTRVQVMGIVNITPDSFSGDGLLQAKNLNAGTRELIVAYVEKLVSDGADIIDIGGESSRPGAKPVSAKEEIKRTVPIIKAIARRIKAPISIDTCKPDVAKAALDGGAVIVNDISGLRDPAMPRLAARFKAGVVIMHMKGKPRTMQKNPVYRFLIEEIIAYLRQAISSALEAGVQAENIIIDPGIGFGKTKEHNLEIVRRLNEFKVLGRPILVGLSRKSFIGKILGTGAHERLAGTLSACVLAAKNGARIVRVHDVLEATRALKIFEAIENA